jgi:hypothetical protein
MVQSNTNVPLLFEGVYFLHVFLIQQKDPFLSRIDGQVLFYWF